MKGGEVLFIHTKTIEKSVYSDLSREVVWASYGWWQNRECSLFWILRKAWCRNGELSFKSYCEASVYGDILIGMWLQGSLKIFYRDNSFSLLEEKIDKKKKKRRGASFQPRNVRNIYDGHHSRLKRVYSNYFIIRIYLVHEKKRRKKVVSKKYIFFI